MMLRNPQRIVVTGRKIRLQILLDVGPGSNLRERFDHSLGILFPVGGFGHRQVIDPSDLVEIDELVRLPDNFDARSDVERRFQAYPGENPRLVNEAV